VKDFCLSLGRDLPFCFVDKFRESDELNLLMGTNNEITEFQKERYNMHLRSLVISYNRKVDLFRTECMDFKQLLQLEKNCIY